jgi:UDP-N-acetylglucosamine--N-acetylmuramyl-(pentapeptide) pyrophosphoryl-undecaprenol N-acetylglucosamine transferase
MKMKLLFVTGKTGGHFFPAMSVAETYQAAHPESEIHMLLPSRELPRTSQAYQNRFSFHAVPVNPLPKAFSLHLFAFLINYPRSLIRTWCLIRQIRPDVVVGFGSYGAFPCLLVARALGIGVLIHEQNRLAGWANRVGAHLASCVFTSFPETIGSLPPKKTFYIGFPLRPDLRREALEARSKRSRALQNRVPLRVLVMGGSQGASALNRLVLEAFEHFADQEKKRIAVIHITGKQDYEAVATRYRELGISSEVHAFYDDMGAIYREASIVISRAGAGTLFELAMFGLPAIFIPYPFAGCHQEHNARYAEKAGGALVLMQQETDGRRLKDAMLELHRDHERRAHMSDAMAKLDVGQPNERMVEAIDNVVAHRFARALNQDASAAKT